VKHDIRRSFGQHWLGASVAYIVMDVLCAALGMGVPFFCIMLGFPVGWFAAVRAWYFVPSHVPAMKRALRYALLTSAVTFVMMAVHWSWLIPKLLDPRVDCGSMGVPLILYEPRASLIGWLILMTIVSPGLQLLMTAFGAYLTFILLDRYGQALMARTGQLEPDNRQHHPD
jgi:hypothetical protein